MKIRGERECRACGERWSYFATGAIECPACGSLQSVGVGERKAHTATPETLDLSDARAACDEDASLETALATAAETCAQYCRKQGFLDGGDLRPLSETYVAAAELRRVAAALDRRMRTTDAERAYALALLRGAEEGDRPPGADVPSSLRSARGRAVAVSVEAYVRDLRTHVGDPSGTLASVLERLTDHRKRVDALDGDVAPATAETLLGAARDASAFVRGGDDDALARASDRLDELY